MDPYDFAKIIEPVVHLERLPGGLVRHLARIEESILELNVWQSNSPLWQEIDADEKMPAVQAVSWKHALDEQPASDVVGMW